MGTSRSKGLLERGASSDLWRHTLSHIPSLFGRLVYLSSLRGGDTGVYEHAGLATLFGEREAHRALFRSHETVFAAWLNYSLERQKEDVDLYLSGLSVDRKSVISAWSRLSPYRNVFPESAQPFERALFLRDFEALLELFRDEFDVSLKRQDA